MVQTTKPIDKQKSMTDIKVIQSNHICDGFFLVCKTVHLSGQDKTERKETESNWLLR